MNIKFNFTTQNTINQVVENQELAVMPATLAQKLLRIYAKRLFESTAEHIIKKHIELLGVYAENNDLPSAIRESLAWVGERDLIQNIANENWDAYEVQQKPTIPAQFAD